MIRSTHSGAVAASKVPSRISTGTSLTVGALTAGAALPTFQIGHSVKRRPCLGCTFSTRSGNPGSAAFAFANVAASVVRLACLRAEHGEGETEATQSDELMRATQREIERGDRAGIAARHVGDHLGNAGGIAALARHDQGIGEGEPVDVDLTNDPDSILDLGDNWRLVEAIHGGREVRFQVRVGVAHAGWAAHAAKIALNELAGADHHFSTILLAAGDTESRTTLRMPCG